MLTYYLEDVAIYLDEIQVGLKERDPKKIYPAAHTIKSSSKQLGAMKVSDFAREIEFAARAISENGESGANTFEIIAARAAEMEGNFRMSETAMKDFLTKESGS